MNATARNIPPRRPNPDVAPSPLETTAPSPTADVMSSQTPKNVAEDQAEAAWECDCSHYPNERTQRILSIPDDDPSLTVAKDEDELFRLLGIPEWRSLL
ncbi:MAG: hypothetical protein LBR22_02430 [Desulfovibrio sp.]|nr:hypothetical protein [Desulfovibrio sp.]